MGGVEEVGGCWGWYRCSRKQPFNAYRMKREVPPAQEGRSFLPHRRSAPGRECLSWESELKQDMEKVLATSQRDCPIRSVESSAAVRFPTLGSQSALYQYQRRELVLDIHLVAIGWYSTATGSVCARCSCLRNKRSRRLVRGNAGTHMLSRKSHSMIQECLIPYGFRAALMGLCGMRRCRLCPTSTCQSQCPGPIASNEEVRQCRSVGDRGLACFWP